MKKLSVIKMKDKKENYSLETVQREYTMIFVIMELMGGGISQNDKTKKRRRGENTESG